MSASLGNVVTVAQQLLDKLGKGTPEILDRRAVAHVEEGDDDTARYWRRVAKAARFILASDPDYLGSGRGPRPIKLPAEMMRQVFQSLPQPTILLQPNLVIVGVNSAYLKTSDLCDKDLLGSDLFDVFPDNPADKAATGARELSESLGRVLDNCDTDEIECMRYDVRNRDGVFEARWWNPVNTPVMDDSGRLTLIIHQVFEVSPPPAAGL